METLQGRVQNGVVVLEGGRRLPEGSQVTVSVPGLPDEQTEPKKGRVESPLVRSSSPGNLILTTEMIAEILDEEDVASGH